MWWRRVWKHLRSLLTTIFNSYSVPSDSRVRNCIRRWRKSASANANQSATDNLDEKMIARLLNNFRMDDFACKLSADVQIFQQSWWAQLTHLMCLFTVFTSRIFYGFGGLIEAVLCAAFSAENWGNFRPSKPTHSQLFPDQYHAPRKSGPRWPFLQADKTKVFTLDSSSFLGQVFTCQWAHHLKWQIIPFKKH